MLADWRSRDRQRLERELRADWYEQRLEELRATRGGFAEVASWDAIAAFMRRGHSTASGDAILRGILERHRADGDPRWRTILLRLLWSVVEYVFQRTRRLDPDEDARWTNVHWAFLRVICRLDVDQRPVRIASKILNDTFHDLRALYASERRQAASPWPEDETGRPLEIACRDPAYEVIDHALNRAALLRRLDELHRTGRLSETDHLLLVGTGVYGRSLEDCAREAGLSYQAAKQRRQRARAAVGLDRDDPQES